MKLSDVSAVERTVVMAVIHGDLTRRNLPRGMAMIAATKLASAPIFAES